MMNPRDGHKTYWTQISAYLRRGEADGLTDATTTRYLESEGNVLVLNSKTYHQKSHKQHHRHDSSCQPSRELSFCLIHTPFTECLETQ